MEHKKTYYSSELPTENGVLTVEGPVTASELSILEFHEGLVAFRQPAAQQEALISIADRPEGRIIIARDQQMVIGYVTFLYPDPLERWAEAEMDDLLMLGAIEVASSYRGKRIGKTMLEIAMQDDAMEDFIILTTEYYWHWDLKGTGLNVWEYRKVMEKMMRAAEMEYYATDDPDITSHPANCLMARIGNRVPETSIKRFDNIRFKNRYFS